VGSGKKAKAKVVAARHYATLDAYVKGEGWKKISPHAKSEADAIKELAALTKKDGGLIYAPEAIKAAGGIVAIEFTDIVPREKK
jgi:ASC-1-like (ASCH) protein